MEENKPNKIEATDAVFQKVEKTPFMQKGISLQHNLLETPEKLSLVSSKGDKILPIFLGIIAAFVAVIFIPFLFRVDSFIIKILLLILPLIFSGLLGWLAMEIAEVSYNQVIYFDKTKQQFIKYKKTDKSEAINIKWTDLHALQVIKKQEKSYEMNLVTKEAKRLHLSTYVNTDLLFKDAETISQLLNIPIWMEGTSGLSMLKDKG